MKRLLIPALFLIIPLFAEELPAFQRGNVLYTQRDFEGALASYMEIEGVSANVDYNIGNTLMRLGRTDEAMAYYRRAQWMAPHDPDLERNMTKASETLSVAVPEIPVWRTLTGWWGPATWQFVFLLSCWITGGLGIACMRVSVLRTNRAWILPPVVGVLALSGFGTWASLPSHFSDEAIIRQTDAVTRFEPLPDATEKARIPAGTVVSILETQRDWVRIQSEDHTGWIENEDLVTL